ncbi:MoxR family ATPase [Lentisphaerota bacterium ZTH]|nr:MoxR family ATPase [Lentisphaerota bacterium]WET05983.1 MoxR family ATPase [Lentisphaerota bacterium ZTH]
MKTITAVLESEKQIEQAVSTFKDTFNVLRSEISRFIVGQEDIIENVLTAVIAGGHVLLEGVPGLGKTALVNTVAQALNLDFKRIQFTPDLLPADLLGTNILLERNGSKEFVFQRGPVFTNVLLADEINRATPKTQSALLETMQEKTVTVANTTHRLDLPYFVLATQNPLEMDGTYPLPEAQLDRFFFKLQVKMPDHEHFADILERTTGLHTPEIKPVTDGGTVLEMGMTARQVPVAEPVRDFMIKLVLGTHPERETASAEVKQFVRYGASPRAAQTILLGARIRALLDGRFHVSREDVVAIAVPAMRHRLILSFEGQTEGISTDEIITDIIKAAR